MFHSTLKNYPDLESHGGGTNITIFEIEFPSRVTRVWLETDHAYLLSQINPGYKTLR